MTSTLYTIWAHDRHELCAPSTFSVATRATEREAQDLVKAYQARTGHLGFQFSYSSPEGTKHD